MQISKRWRTILLLPLIVALPFAASGAKYQSVLVDESGQLHIVLDSGNEVLPRKTRWQVSFANPVISPDRRTVGWVVMCPDPSFPDYQGAQLACNLVVYRAEFILHTFQAEPVLWDWRFQDGGKRVAYSTGPTHGGAAECILRDVNSGRIVSRWRIREGFEPPVWAKTLRRDQTNRRSSRRSIG